MKDATCTEESSNIPLTQTSLMICHTLTESSLKTSAWHWQQVIVWEESLQEDIGRTKGRAQQVNPDITVTKRLLYMHKLGTTSGSPKQGQHLHTQTIGRMLNLLGTGLVMGVPTQHINGAIVRLEGAHRGDAIII